MSGGIDNNSTNSLLIKISTISLSILAVVVVSLILYQNFVEPNTSPKTYSISSDKAKEIATAQIKEQFKKTAEIQTIKTVRAKLVHVDKDGLSLVSDENSLDEIQLYGKGKVLPEFRDRYFWRVEFLVSVNDNGERGYYYIIDAQTGRIIGDDSNLIFFETPQGLPSFEMLDGIIIHKNPHHVVSKRFQKAKLERIAM